jgi:prepilin-type processing-associated H-X9-DG protein
MLEIDQIYPAWFAQDVVIGVRGQIIVALHVPERDFSGRDRGAAMVIRTEEELTKCNWMDVRHYDHLPSASENTRRWAPDRHKPLGINCLYVDGHTSATNAQEITLYDLGAADADRGVRGIPLQ